MGRSPKETPGQVLRKKARNLGGFVINKIIEIGPDMIRFMLIWWVAPTVAFSAFVGAWSWCDGLD